MRLKLRPSVHFRPHDAAGQASYTGAVYASRPWNDRYEIAADAELAAAAAVPARRTAPPSPSTARASPTFSTASRRAAATSRTATLWSPGYFRVDLTRDHDVTLVASTEAWETLLALKPPEAFEAERERRDAPVDRRAGRRCGPARPASWCWPPTSSSSRRPAASRTPPAPRPPATRCARVIAGYHWFTDWGRDTMISLEGLTLTTGRHAEAGYILRTFAHYVRDGLIPNMFPEGEKRGPLPHRRRHALVLPRH